MGGGGVTEGWPYFGQISEFATTFPICPTSANLRLGTEVGRGQPDLEEFLEEEQPELLKEGNPEAGIRPELFVSVFPFFLGGGGGRRTKRSAVTNISFIDNIMIIVNVQSCHIMVRMPHSRGVNNDTN